MCTVPPITDETISIHNFNAKNSLPQTEFHFDFPGLIDTSLGIKYSCGTLHSTKLLNHERTPLQSKTREHERSEELRFQIRLNEAISRSQGNESSMRKGQEDHPQST